MLYSDSQNIAKFSTICRIIKIESPQIYFNLITEYQTKQRHNAKFIKRNVYKLKGICVVNGFVSALEVYFQRNCARSVGFPFEFNYDIDNHYRFHISKMYNIFQQNLMESDEQNQSQEVLQGRWIKDQHDRFLAGIITHGKDWKIVEKVVKTRTGSQVRSHAQKFFIKLNKINKERKKCKNCSLIQPSQIQREILDQFTELDITSNTPIQISAVLRKDWKAVAESFKQKKKLSKPNKSVSRKFSKQEFENQEDKMEQDVSFGSLNNQLKENDQSYFIKVIKSNREHFVKGHDFKELIDFGNMILVQKNQSQVNVVTGKQRKKSFWLPEDQQNDTKLRQTLKELRRRMHDPPEGNSI